MKAVLLPLLALVAGLIGTMVVGRGGPPTEGPRVGTRPGDVGSAEDIDVAALSRGHELATFAAGCFWHVEEVFRRLPGVTATAVGFSGGHTLHPTYKEVCTGKTGHAETVLIEFDPKRVSYEQLLGTFFKEHDPTSLNRQGPDVGAQYRSAIFYRNAEQERVARKAIAGLQSTYGRPIVTQVAAAGPFTLAEEYHQQYVEKSGVDACPR